MTTGRTPARRVRNFTAGKKRAFVEFIAKGYSPTHAAKEIGLSRQAAYAQRNNDHEFAAAWSEAQEEQADLYEDALRRAALEQKNIGGIIFGLKNLRSDKWKDKHEVDVNRHSVNLNIQVSEGQAERIAAIAAREWALAQGWVAPEGGALQLTPLGVRLSSPLLLRAQPRTRASPRVSDRAAQLGPGRTRTVLVK